MSERAQALSWAENHVSRTLRSNSEAVLFAADAFLAGMKAVEAPPVGVSPQPECQRCRMNPASICTGCAAFQSASLSPVEPTPPCAICGKPATCHGSYDGAPEGFACDDCCGHGCEDGKCSPVEPTPRNRSFDALAERVMTPEARERARDIAAELLKVEPTPEPPRSETDKGVPLAVRQEAHRCATQNGRISYDYLVGLYRRGAEARTVVDRDGAVLTQAAIYRLLDLAYPPAPPTPAPCVTLTEEERHFAQTAIRRAQTFGPNTREMQKRLVALFDEGTPVQITR